MCWGRRRTVIETPGRHGEVVTAERSRSICYCGRSARARGRYTREQLETDRQTLAASVIVTPEAIGYRPALNLKQRTGCPAASTPWHNTTRPHSRRSHHVIAARPHNAGGVPEQEDHVLCRAINGPLRLFTVNAACPGAYPTVGGAAGSQGQPLSPRPPGH